MSIWFVPNADEQPAKAPGVPSANEVRMAVAPRRVLFLDFDGVLHPPPDTLTLSPLPVSGPCLFGWLPHLVSILGPFPDVGVVVHSGWRYVHHDDELFDMLAGLQDRLLGSTPLRERYSSIQVWLTQHPTVTDFRILDDEPDEFPRPLPSQLIVCDPTVGVSGVEPTAELRAWLCPFPNASLRRAP